MPSSLSDFKIPKLYNDVISFGNFILFFSLKAAAVKVPSRNVDASEDEENNLEIMAMYSQNTPQITCEFLLCDEFEEMINFIFCEKCNL